MSAEVIVGVLLIITFLNKSSVLHKEKKVELPSSQKIELTQVYSSEDKIKNFILKQNNKISEEEAKLISQLIIQYAEEAKVDAKLLSALICRESRFNYKAVSASGAGGLGQLMPNTAKSLGVSDIFNPEDNIRGTAYYLRRMLDLYQGEERQLELALLSYRLGPNAVKNSSLEDLLKNPSYLEYIESIKNYYQQI